VGIDRRKCGGGIPTTTPVPTQSEGKDRKNDMGDRHDLGGFQVLLRHEEEGTRGDDTGLGLGRYCNYTIDASGKNFWCPDARPLYHCP